MSAEATVRITATHAKQALLTRAASLEVERQAAVSRGDTLATRHYEFGLAALRQQFDSYRDPVRLAG